MSDAVTHVYEVYIRTTPEKLWDAIVDAEKTRQYFFGCAVTSDWTAGAQVTYAMEDGYVPFDATIEAIEPQKRLVHSFRAKSEDGNSYAADPPSLVTYEIEGLGETCLLRLTHEHFAGETATAKSTHHGWPVIVSGLKTLLETGEPLKIERKEEARVS
ncbi:MAG: SRPBCC family protein [Candidatus Eremiobacteraeota bacterium]|nr:SRPBCC family protein [Candidatus Eremiobacteraeota bacterium]